MGGRDMHMTLRNAFGKYRLLLVTVAAYLVVLFYDPDTFMGALKLTSGYIKEMLQVMPAVFVLTALIATWVPRNVIATNLGDSSGLRGMLASIVIGSLSAGPIYAAFPIAQALLQKGAGIGNVVIIISAWAVIKVPMLAVEARFLGVPFMALRYLWTVPSIFLMGVLFNKVSRRFALLDHSVIHEGTDADDEIRQLLPGHNCRACGFPDCSAYARAIVQENADVNACVPGGNDVATKIKALLGAKRAM